MDSMPVASSSRSGQWGWGIARGVRSAKRRFAPLTLLTLIGLGAVLQATILAFFLERDAVEALREQAAIRVEVAGGAADADVQGLYAELRALPTVERVTYVTKEQAYEEERLRDPALIAFLEQFDLQNPFPDTLNIVLTSADAYGELTTFLGQERWSDVVDPQFLPRAAASQDHLRSLLAILRGAAVFLLALGALAGAVLVLVVASALRGDAKPTSSADMHWLLGASPTVVYLPAFAEGLLLSLVAVVGGSIVLGAGFLAASFSGFALDAVSAAVATSFMRAFFAGVLATPFLAILIALVARMSSVPHALLSLRLAAPRRAR